MLLSLGIIFGLGIIMGKIFGFIKLPPLTGMIITGIIIGPFALGLLDDKILSISAELRKIALIIILMRAGLNLDVRELKKVGRPAFLMCFLPATFEILAMVFFAPKILGVTTLEAAILGTVVAAVSPAVIVPKMLKLMEEGCGKTNSIPQLIMAGASADDVFVIVLFTAFTTMATGGEVSALAMVEIPVSIVLGIGIGIVLGVLVNLIFNKISLSDGQKVVFVIAVSFVIVTAEDVLKDVVAFSSLLSVMSMGITIQRKNLGTSKVIAAKMAELWSGAEILLFVLVGATVNIEYAMSAGFGAVAIIFVVLVFRMIGVYVCMTGSQLPKKERLFCMIAYTPKATVQAAIGSIPLTMGLDCGNIVLTVAVLAILITAPVGAFAIEKTYRTLL